MGKFNPEVPELEKEGKLISATREILGLLEAKKTLSDDEHKVLAELFFRLSSFIYLVEDEGEEISEAEEQLIATQRLVTSWEAAHCMIWDSSPEEASEYLNAVEKVQRLVARLESASPERGDKNFELLSQARDVLQVSMARLGEELRYLLDRDRQPFAPDPVSFRSNDDDTADEHSVASIGDESFDEMPQGEASHRGLDVIDLVKPGAVPDIKRIARLMFLSGYERECSQAFVSARREALDECLRILEIESLSIDCVSRMEWGSLNSKIKRWVWALKLFVPVYLASEKWLHDQIFSELGSLRDSCRFVEASKASVLRLLNFGEAVAISPPKPEKLFGILDMYEVLSQLLPCMDALFEDEAIRSECREVLSSLGDSARTTFLDFENAIASSSSVTPIADGRIHPLTRYVMNHIRNLTDYGGTLNLLLRDHAPRHPTPPSCPDSPMARHLHSLTSILESSLASKSRLYKSAALQEFFLMNNVCYMAEKVKGSELRAIFGDDWIKKCNRRFRQHAMNYERATWSAILPLLSEEGIPNPNTSSVSKELVKDRLRRFYVAFEEVYKTQTGWMVPDPRLREDLLISSSVKVCQAYRTFIGRHGHSIREKHVKYSDEDIQNCLLDFFIGSQRSLQNLYRR